MRLDTRDQSGTDLDDKGRVRIGDNLWYVHPVTGEHFISVTSITDGMSSDALGDYWKPDQTAAAALDNLPKLIRATRLKPCGRTYSKCRTGADGHDWRIRCDECPCDECGPCVRLWLRDEHFRRSREARERGSAVHNWIEQWLLNDGHGIEIADEYRPYTDAFRRFVDDYGLTPDSWELYEAKVINRTHGWGGTLDGAIRFDATASRKARELCEMFGLAKPLLLNDWKTREDADAKFYDSHAIQTGTYRRGEFVMLPDGTEVPMPQTDGAVVIQLHADGTYHVRPMVTDGEEYEGGFLPLLAHKRWSLRRSHVVASVWHHQRDERGQVVTGADGKPVRVTTFPRREIPGLAPEPKPAKRTPAKAASAPVAPAASAGTAPPKKTATPRKSTSSRAAKTAQPELPAPPRLDEMELLRAGRTPGGAQELIRQHGFLRDDDIPF